MSDIRPFAPTRATDPPLLSNHGLEAPLPPGEDGRWRGAAHLIQEVTMAVVEEVNEPG